MSRCQWAAKLGYGHNRVRNKKKERDDLPRRELNCSQLACTHGVVEQESGVDSCLWSEGLEYSEC
jgi:hypothetical protein